MNSTVGELEVGSAEARATAASANRDFGRAIRRLRLKQIAACALGLVIGIGGGVVRPSMVDGLALHGEHGRRVCRR